MQDVDLKQAYLDTLLLYYEEEIIGEAYFYALAARLVELDQKQKMNLMGDVERHAANAVRPLLQKYSLTPRLDKTLHALGSDQAAADAASWDGLLAEMRRTFPGYIDDFHNLEKLAPDEDLVRLRFLTEHEHAAIKFLKNEAVGRAKSAEPLSAYLSSTPTELAARSCQRKRA